MFQEDNFKKFSDIVSEKYDGALITPSSNLFYLTGLDPENVMERLFIFITYPNKQSVLISPDLYENEIDQTWIDEIIFWSDNEDPNKILNNYLEDLENNKGKLLIEDSMEASKIIKIQDFLNDFELLPLSYETSDMRLIKNKQEIKCLKKAAQIVDEVFDDLIKKELKGKTEKEVAALIEFLIKKNGGEGTAFNTIVASGHNASNPHHATSDKKLEKGELVILDYGAKYKGYCSDITRTIAVEDCSEKAKEIYEIVKQAQERACKSVDGNIQTKVVDKIARDIITEAGYGEYFTHRVGHGIGLDPHEEPYLHTDNEKKLKYGMSFTIEPGIYIRNKLGVRIEDDILIQKGSKRLTKTNRDLIFVK